jgi:hypothetical protein
MREAFCGDPAMIDSFVLLAPILLLGIIALLGFVGCLSKPDPPVAQLAIAPNSGPTTGGTQVVITSPGAAFAGSPTVTFGSSPDPTVNATQVTVIDTNTMMAVTPAYPIAKPVNVTARYTGSSGTDFSGTLPQNSFFTYFSPVSHVQTALGSAGGGTSIQSPPLALQGGELLLVTLQWGGTGTPALSGATVQSLPGGAYPWSGMKVQVFSGMNTVSGQVVVKATLSSASPVAWRLCVSAYDGADSVNPTYSPVASPDGNTGKALQTPAPIAANAGDLIYSVAFAADAGGAFPGTANALTPGTGFTAESGIGNPLVQDQQVVTAAGISATATNTTANTNPRWWIFAVGVKAS